MRKTIAALAVAALAAGCGKNDSITQEEARNAMPNPASLQIDTPPDAAARTAAAAALAAGAVEGGSAAEFNPGFSTSSDYARWTYFTAWTVNGGTWWTLTLVRFITLFPPTERTDSTFTWGPWEEESAVTPGLMIKRWKLVVTKVGEGHFEYALSAENLLDPAGYLPIVSGVAYPTDPWHGHGTITISFDNARQMPEPKNDYGVLSIQYDNRSALTVSATVEGAHSAEDGTVMNAAYSFSATASGGELQVAFEKQTGTPATLSLRSRWDGTGAGRGDAKLFTTDGTWTLTGTASECWAGRAGNFALTYDTDPPFGEVAGCPAAFQSALYSDLVVP